MSQNQLTLIRQTLYDLVGERIFAFWSSMAFVAVKIPCMPAMRRNASRLPDFSAWISWIKRPIRCAASYMISTIRRADWVGSGMTSTGDSGSTAASAPSAFRFWCSHGHAKRPESRRSDLTTLRQCAVPGNPSRDGAVGYDDPALRHHSNEVPIAQPIGDVPANALLDDFNVEHRSVVRGSIQVQGLTLRPLPVNAVRF